jgi:hypothetical protein
MMVARNYKVVQLPTPHRRREDILGKRALIPRKALLTLVTQKRCLWGILNSPIRIASVSEERVRRVTPHALRDKARDQVAFFEVRFSAAQRAGCDRHVVLDTVNAKEGAPWRFIVRCCGSAIRRIGSPAHLAGTQECLFDLWPGRLSWSVRTTQRAMLPR